MHPVNDSIGRSTARGFAWLTLEAVGDKLVQLAGQLVLAQMLVPAHFGLLAKALTVTAFINLLQEPGIRIVLIQRGNQFRRWAAPAFWMSISAGIAGGILTLLAAPLAAAIYKTDELIGLLAVLALTAPLRNCGIVPEARLRCDLRFGRIAIVRFVALTATMALTIVLAWLDYGAYSFVIPRPIIAAAESLAYWLLSPVRISFRLRLKRWRFLFSDTGTLFLASLFRQFTWQGDYIILGILHNDIVVGIYYFAFSMSTQAMMLLTNNLSRTLFPALAKMQTDTKRVLRNFLSAIRLLALLGVPACLLQASLAKPIFTIFLNSEYQPVIPVLQILSIGMAFRLTGSAAGSLLQSQGRFGTILVMNIAYAAFFLTAVTIGAIRGGSISVACAVALFYAGMGPVHLYVAIRTCGGQLVDVARMLIKPWSLGLIAVGLATLATRTLPEITGRDWWCIAVTILGSIAIYCPAIWFCAKDDCRHLLSRLQSVLPQQNQADTVNED